MAQCLISAIDRDFAGFTFCRITIIKPQRDASGEIEHFMPQLRYKNVRGLPLHKHGNGPFCRLVIRGLPWQAGVYIITAEGDAVYSGECENLAARFGLSQYGMIQPRNCYRNGQSTNCKINNLILQCAKANRILELWFHVTDQRFSVESKIILALRPPWNNQLPFAGPVGLPKVEPQ